MTIIIVIDCLYYSENCLQATHSARPTFKTQNYRETPDYQNLTGDSMGFVKSLPDGNNLVLKRPFFEWSLV